MFVASDIPAFREQIFANAALLYQENDQGLSLTRSTRKFEIVCYTQDDGKVYIASLIDLSTRKVVLSGATDTNFAIAVHNLFDETASKLARMLGDKEADKKDDSKRHQTISPQE